MKARSAKAKGTRLEKWTMDQLRSIGITARKQPGSGIFQDFPHDVYAELPDGRFVVECKSWKHGWRTGDKAMGQADCLVMKRDYATPAVYMSWEFFARLIGLAQEGRSTALHVQTNPSARCEVGADSAGMTLDEIAFLAGNRTNVPQSLLTGKPKPKPEKRKWPSRKVRK